MTTKTVTNMAKELATILALFNNPTTKFRVKCFSGLTHIDRGTDRRKFCDVGFKKLLKMVADCLLEVGNNKLPADHELIIMIEEICRQLLVEEPYTVRKLEEPLHLKERYELCLVEQKHNIDQTYLTSGKIPCGEIYVLIGEVMKHSRTVITTTDDHKKLYIYLYLTRQALTK